MDYIDFVKYIDFFGIKFHFYTNYQPSHQNIFGGIMSFIYVLSCIGIFILFSYDDIYRLNPISSISEIYDLEPRNINIKNEKIWIPFRIVTNENEYVDHRGILYIEPYYVQGKYNNQNNMEFNYHLLEYKLCNETSMANKPENYIIDVPLNELFCISDDDIPLGGNWNENFINYIGMNLFLCKEGIYFNSSDSRCDGINNLFKNLNSSILFDFYYPVVQFQPTNSKNPISIVYKNSFYRLSAYSHKLTKLYIQEHIFSDDKNLIKSNYKNFSCWGTSTLYGDDYYLNENNDPIIKNKLNYAFSMEIFMDYGLIYYTRTYNKIFYIISNVFPLFKFVLFILKKFTQHIKLSVTKRDLAGLIFEKKSTSKISLFKLEGDSNKNLFPGINKKPIKKLDESKNNLLKERNNNPKQNNPSNDININIIQNNISLKNNFNNNEKNDDKNSNNKSNNGLNNENLIKEFSMKNISLINPKRDSIKINENLKKKELSNNELSKRNQNNLFSFYYFFFDFIFDKLINPRSFLGLSKAYFTVYNFMCQIYDISTHVILFKQFNLLNSTLKKIYEENGFCPAHPYKKLNINNNDLIERLNKDLKKKKSLIFSKNLF